MNYPEQAICGLRMVREDVAGAGTEIDQKMTIIIKLKIRHWKVSKKSFVGLIAVPCPIT